MRRNKEKKSKGKEMREEEKIRKDTRGGDMEEKRRGRESMSQGEPRRDKEKQGYKETMRANETRIRGYEDTKTRGHEEITR